MQGNGRKMQERCSGAALVQRLHDSPFLHCASHMIALFRERSTAGHDAPGQAEPKKMQRHTKRVAAAVVLVTHGCVTPTAK